MTRNTKEKCNTETGTTPLKRHTKHKQTTAKHIKITKNQYSNKKTKTTNNTQKDNIFKQKALHKKFCLTILCIVSYVHKIPFDGT